MQPSKLLCVAVVCLASLLPVRAADDLIEQLATCRASWFDWKDDPARMRTLAEAFNAAFVPKSEGSTFVPKGRVLVAGLPVSQAYPQSVGMGVGFSVVVDAAFEDARSHVEKATGTSLKKCEMGEGMRSCAAEIAEKRTLMVMGAEKGGPKTTLVGCYYFYEK